MAPSSVQFPPSQRSQQSQNPKADQIVWRYLKKVVLSVANARIISPDSQDPQDAPAPDLPVNDYEEGGGTPTGSISVAAPGPSSAVVGGGTAGGSKTRPKVDKWFNLETPDLDTFKPTLDIFKQISTTFPIAPVEIAIDPPPLIVQVLLSIPQPSLNPVLVLNHGDNRTRIDPTPRYILLESWRVDITRRISESHETASSTSTSSSFSSSSNSSFYDVELSTVYKQSITLFRSIYTLLRVLPTWKLYRRLQQKRTGPGSGMTLELRVEVLSQSASPSAASSVVDLPLVVDSIPIIGFDTPLSQHHPANKVETRAFSSIPSPLGELKLSLKYRVETNFTLESLESLLSTGLVSTDIQTDLFAPIELFLVSSNPPPNYPNPPYPPISDAAPPPGRKDEAEPSRQPRPPAGDDEFDFVSDFTPIVVAEQQRIRRESHTARLAAAGPLIGTSSSGGRNLGTANVLQGGRSGLPLTQSPRSLPGSLSRESLPVGTSLSLGSTGPTYAIGQQASAVPPRSRYNSTPHSSTPPSNNTNFPRGLAQQPLNPPNPIALTPTQPFSRQQLPPEGQPLHSRTISMPGGTARPPPVPLPATGVSPAPLSSMARMFSREDLPVAAPSTNASGSGGTLIRRVRKESTSALSSTSSGGGGEASPTRPVFTYSPRSGMTPLPSPALPFGRRESGQLTPPNAVGPVPLPTASDPRRSSLNAIAPFKSGTLSSSPSSFGAGRINSPISERITSSPLDPGAASRQLVVGAGTGFSQSPRSPIPMAMRQAGAVGTADSSPNSNPYGSPSPAPQGDLLSKRLSGSSMESAGMAGAPSSRLSEHATQSPELAGAGVPAPPKRYSSSFTHRYRDSTSTTGSAALVTGTSGVPRSVGSGSSAGGTSLGLTGVGVGEPRRLDKLYSAASTDDDDIQALVQAIDNRPQLRGGTPPISRLSGSPASHPSEGSLPRTQTAEGEGAARGRPSLSSLNAPIQQLEASLPLIHEDTVAASPSSRTPADIRVPVTSARDLDDRIRAMTAQFNESIGSVARTRLQSNPSTPSEDVRTGGRSAFVSAVSRIGNGSPRNPVTRLASRERSEQGHRRSGSGTGPEHASRPLSESPPAPSHATTPTHARRGSRSHSRSPGLSNTHNAIEGHIIGGSELEASLPEPSSSSGRPQTSATSHNALHSLQFPSRQTNQGSASSHLASPAHPAADHDQQGRILAKQLATINCVPVLATEEVVDLLQALGRAAPQAVRNKHKIYSILRVAHDTCSYVVETGILPGGQKDAGLKQLLDRMEKYCIVLDALEEILLQFAEILPSEITVFGPEMYSSWLQSRSIFARILDKLCHPPFPTISYKTQDIAEDSFFDDCSWLSRVLYSGIDAEVAAQFPDPSVAHPALAVTEGLHYLVSQIKHGTQNEQTREVVLDIATLLARTLAATSPNHDGELRQREPSSPTAASRDWLIQALADSFSIFDLDTTLDESTAQDLASKWTEIKTSFTSRGLSAREN